MNTYAVVKLGPSQQKVSLGDLVITDKINKEVGDKFEVSDVYLMSDGENVTVGTPTLGINVGFEVVSHGKGEKVTIHKFKAKSRYKKTTGFRAQLTTLKVLSIGDTKAKAKTEKTPKAEAKEVSQVSKESTETEVKAPKIVKKNTTVKTSKK